MTWSCFARGGLLAAVLASGTGTALAAPVVESPACKPSWFEAKRLAALIESHAPDRWFDRVSVRVPRCEDREALELVVSSSTASTRRTISVADAPRSQRTRTLALVIASIEAPKPAPPKPADRNGPPPRERRTDDAGPAGEGKRRGSDETPNAPAPPPGVARRDPDARTLAADALAPAPDAASRARKPDAPDRANGTAPSRSPSALDPTRASESRDDARARPVVPRDEDPLAASAVVAAPSVHALTIEATTTAYPAKRSLLFGGALAYVHRFDELLRLTAGAAAAFGRTRIDLGAIELTAISARVGAGLCPVRGDVSVCGFAAAEAGLAIVAGVAEGTTTSRTERATFFGLAFDLVVDYALSDDYALAARVGLRPTIRGVEGGSPQETVGVGGFGFAAGLGVVRSF